VYKHNALLVSRNEAHADNKSDAGMYIKELLIVLHDLDHFLLTQSYSFTQTTLSDPRLTETPRFQIRKKKEPVRQIRELLKSILEEVVVKM
jgi:hypothetical protein